LNSTFELLKSRRAEGAGRGGAAERTGWRAVSLPLRCGITAAALLHFLARGKFKYEPNKN